MRFFYNKKNAKTIENTFFKTQKHLFIVFFDFCNLLNCNHLNFSKIVENTYSYHFLNFVYN